MSPWVRACALRALDPSIAGAREVLTRAAAESDGLVAETASAVLAASSGAEPFDEAARAAYTTVDKVILLKEVTLFNGMAHEELADVAGLLSERWVAKGKRSSKRASSMTASP